MDNKVALVTGAAGGIGLAVARRLAEEGASVAAVDLDAKRLSEAVEKLAADGLTARAYPADVTSTEQVEAVVDQVEADLGPLDFLVNTAGILRTGEVRDFSDEDWLQTFEVNVSGVFRLSRAAVNRMVPNNRGAIVTVASNASGTPRTGMAAYGASKAAATMLTKSLGLEVARYNIRCNVVAPGSTDTAMLASLWEDEQGPAKTIAGSPESYKVGIPLGKLARTSDIAEAVLFLLSDRAAHITLHVLTVDGGATLGA
ncbi:2,3-dihydro-2,3-dihydroxybenzoate dehydrogenase [Streptomyces sp. NBC_01408]|uniref:2,3-dihydro-2,3-dihydroxybenzoate dehydrogenase n=1 Tax=Streptomyces sp. NBC_01408 TaxID=2903855 RepID=UPI0022518B40|nr:2,3-dihydro-2,3-dihydroxybenzoate dehydrogenase [Streptomyces sp. NBC_01408]MCX4696569.1 2,3-dihydro-2,3-dihydroxybenzoate dehydrogenase [Streptomyces sp. NBC_01408]